jgi:hypothetical protein
MDGKRATHLKLAGVTRLSLHGRGPKDAFVFDPHRLALPCWGLALEHKPPALLITFDRHLDLVAPRVQVPHRPDVRQLDELARWQLDERNVDHILAAMEAGLLTDALVIARSRPVGAREGGAWIDSRNGHHEVRVVPSLERLDASWFRGAVESADSIILDFDVDCFTSLGETDPTDVVPWPMEAIRSFILPEGSEDLWSAVLAKTWVLTIAREPYHCGGLIPAGRLFEALAQVLFVELLGADLP